MDARLFLALLALLTLVATPKRALAAPGSSSSWTADDAVAEALANPDIEAVLEAELELARAELDEATVHPTPELGVDFEQVFGDAQVGYTQTTFMIYQRFDFAPWRRRLRESLPHREDARRAASEQWRLELAATVRRAFYRVRYHEERIAALDRWIARLERSAEATDKRRERGDASRYAVRRVEREREIAVARRARERSQLAAAWAELATWTSWEQQPDLLGRLPPDPPPAATPASTPEIAKLEQRQLALGAELDAWGVPFGRGWELGAGYRLNQVGDADGHGFMITLSLPLTLWNTDKPRKRRLRAEKSRVEGELGLARTVAERGQEAARTRLEQALEALAELPSAEQDAELSGLAEAAFGAGEGTLTELLDAYGSETELELARIDLEWEARLAEIELLRRLGIGATQ